MQVVVLAALANSRDARAQPVDAGTHAAASEVILRWTAPPECPTQNDVLVDAHTLSDPKGRQVPRATLVIDATVEKVATHRWSVTLVLGDARRRIEASSCAQLARATALFVTLVMDPSRGDEPADAPTGAPPASERAPSPPPTRAPEPPRERANFNGDTRNTFWLAAAGSAIETGILPHPELLAAIGIGVSHRRFELTLEGASGAPQDTTSSPQGGARLWPVLATVRTCYELLAWSTLRAGPCLQAEIGWLHASGKDVSQQRSTVAEWLSLGGGLAAAWVLGSWVEARLHVQALVPVVHPNVQLTGYQAPGTGYATQSETAFETGLGIGADAALVFRF